MKQIWISPKLLSGSTLTTFYEHFSSNAISNTKRYDLIRHLQSVIDSISVEKIMLPNQNILLLY